MSRKRFSWVITFHWNPTWLVNPNDVTIPQVLYTRILRLQEVE